VTDRVVRVGDRLMGLIVEDVVTSAGTGVVTITLRPREIDEDLCSCAVQQFAHYHHEELRARTWMLP